MDRSQEALCVEMIFPLNGKGRGGVEEGGGGGKRNALSELVGGVWRTVVDGPGEVSFFTSCHFSL